jgi:predicted SAM-dependent methyltransferase
MRPWLSSDLERDPTFRKANLGCGTLIFNDENGWTNVDQFSPEGMDVLAWDMTEIPGPFEDDTFDYLLMSNILEHMPHNLDRYRGEFWNHLENELLRITRPGGVWEIHGPDPRNATVELQRGGHARLVGPVTFEHLVIRYHVGGMAVTEQHERFGLKVLDRRTWYGFGARGYLTDYNARKHLGRGLGDVVARVIGRPWQIRLVYRVVK